jgi:hypothetical protein
MSMTTYNNNIMYRIKKQYLYCCRHWCPQAPRMMARLADAGDYAKDDLNMKVPRYL